MRKSLLFDTRNIWEDEMSRYPLIGYVVVCLIILWLKISNAFPMTIVQTLLPEIIGSIILAAYFFFLFLGKIIPDSWKTFGMQWRVLKPGRTFIRMEPNWLRVFMHRLTWSITPFKGYFRRVTESRSRQGFWLKP